MRPLARIVGPVVIALVAATVGSPATGAAESVTVAAAPTLAPAAIGDPGTFVPLTPGRIADTRSAIGGVQGPVPHDTTVSFQVRGQRDVPAEATAVVLNVTAVDPQGSGYFTIYPSGTARPNSSSLNVVPNRDVANLVIARIGSDGKVSLYNFGGPAHVLFDVTGYFVAGTGAGRFYGAAPHRMVDTRTDPRLGGPIIPIGPGSRLQLQLNSELSSTTHWAAVLVNITATNTTANGYLTVLPAGDPVPDSSNLNFVAGQTVANAVIVKMGPAPQGGSGITIFNAFGSTDVIVDLMGVFDDGTLASGFTVPSAFRALEQPERVYDTRTTKTPYTGQTSRIVNVAGAGGAPAGASGVVMNATVTNTTAPSYLTIWPSNLNQPNVSSVNWGPGQTVPNFVGSFVAPSGPSAGALSVYNDTGNTDVIFDVTGYFYPLTPPPG